MRFLILALFFVALVSAAVSTPACQQNQVCVTELGFSSSTRFTPVEIEQSVPTITKTAFIQKSVSQASEARDNGYCFSVSVAVAQAMLESRSGTSSLSYKYGNLFGIKANANCNGKLGEHLENGFVCLYTKENQGTKNEKTIIAAFKTFKDKNPFEDYAKFVLNPRYSKAISPNCVKNYSCYAREIHRAGYATDAFYSEKLSLIVRKYSLDKYDKAC